MAIWSGRCGAIALLCLLYCSASFHPSCNGARGCGLYDWSSRLCFLFARYVRVCLAAKARVYSSFAAKYTAVSSLCCSFSASDAYTSSLAGGRGLVGTTFSIVLSASLRGAQAVWRASTLSARKGVPAAFAYPPPV